MDKVVRKSPSPKEKKRLKLLQEELEGQELTILLERLQKQCDLSVNQMADTAGMDESALHKILKGENREFKAEHVDALLDELERQGKIPSAYERTIWQRALRIAAFLHFDLYKAIEPRLRQIEDVGKRIEALKTYLCEQYPSLAETYDKSGGAFPIFVPIFNIVADELNKRWGWIRIPPGYRLIRVDGTRYYLASTDLFPKTIIGSGPDVEIEDTGFGTYTVRQRVAQVQPAQPKSKLPESKFKRIGDIDFVRVSAGKSLMGSLDEKKYVPQNEKHRHVANISYDYWIGRYPVTNGQYAKFVITTNRQHEWVNDWMMKMDHPVVHVSVYDSQAYCEWLNETQSKELSKGFIFRLPTEAEWEKAARGEFGFAWPWGNEFDKNKCNSVEGGRGGTTSVGAYSPAGDSPYGAADMVGNVWEWVRFLYVIPQPGDGQKNWKANVLGMLCGGSWRSSWRDARCSGRRGCKAGQVNHDVGFRIAVVPSHTSLVPHSGS